MIIVKRTDAIADWGVYHRQLNGGTDRGHWRIKLNSTGSQSSQSTFWNNTAPTDSVFTVGTSTSVNASGGTYVAYVFAHNDGDGGFGAAGDADIIKCGSYTGNGSTNGPEIDLGFEPQWVLLKGASASSNWLLYDVMRGLTVGTTNAGADQLLQPHTSNAEYTDYHLSPTSTGFKVRDTGGDTNTSGNTYIYMAIRRGTKVPESGTEVFAIHNQAGSYSSPTNVGFPVDLSIMAKRTGTSSNSTVGDRLRGSTKFLSTSQSNAEDVGIDWQFDLQNNFQSTWTNDTISWMWKRASGYFDAVAYTGNGTNPHNISHNLGVAPEMMWSKRRDSTGQWEVYYDTGNPSVNNGLGLLRLNSTGTDLNGTSVWGNTHPTDSVFTVGSNGTNRSGADFIMYLFASLPGISKVGSFTATGSTLNVDCGFTSGARFVLIKRTDSTGDWFVFDSVRGITASTSPYLYLNSTSSENVANYIDPLSSGFTVTTSFFGSGDFIFYAIA
jgi:hypothetical protein